MRKVGKIMLSEKMPAFIMALFSVKIAIPISRIGTVGRAQIEMTFRVPIYRRHHKSAAYVTSPRSARQAP